MTKQQIHQLFIDQLTEELEAVTAATKSSIDTATNKEHQAKSKYDTFGLESSYLARGQAKRVEELIDALDRLQMLPLKELDDSSLIQLSALIRLKSKSSETRSLFFGPAGGGEAITVEGEEIVIVTSRSPLGQAVLGKSTGYTFSIKLGDTLETFTISSVT